MTENFDQPVLHDKENQRFVLTVDDQQVYTKYHFTDSETLEFYSTYTPAELRGRGLAAKVVNAALDYVEQNNLNAQATCWYFKKIMDARVV